MGPTDANNREQPDHSDKKQRFAVVIPTYNHGRSVEAVITEVLKLDLPVFVVDDGSTDDTAGRISRFSDIRILRHEKNLGKGAALLTGFSEAMQIADWAITLDADGQHNPADAAAMMRTARKYEKALIVGRRTGMDHGHVHWTSRFGRKFSNFWVRVSGGPKISDSQSGFRIYPLPEAACLDVKSRRFEFEVEILVRAHWKGLPIAEVPVGVSYLPPEQRISHFRPWRDFLRNTVTFAGLIMRSLLYRPQKNSSENKA